MKPVDFLRASSALCLSLIFITAGCIDDTVPADRDGDRGAGEEISCTVDGVEYPEGAAVPAEDGCNSCECVRGMLTRCTLIGCLPPACSEEACGPAPNLPSFLCEDGVTMGGRGPCERQENGECGWTINDCIPAETCEAVSCPDGRGCEAGVCLGGGDPCDGLECPDGQRCEAGECIMQAACTEEACGPQPNLPSFLCDDGVSMGGLGPCERQENGECGWTINECPDPCAEILCERGSRCVDGLCVDDPDFCVPGEDIPAGDGCNRCTCPESGLRAEATDCTLSVCETECANDAACPDGQYCDFPNDDCGIYGGSGICQPRRNDPCDPGGSGACGCNGMQGFSSCDLYNAGTDFNRYGGCQIDFIGEDQFLCGNQSCDAQTDYCSITMNDVAGPDQPEFFAACLPRPEGCAQGNCDCLALPELPGVQCYSENGYSVVLSPGG
ncbi:MAG: hypothetical protein VYD19_11250 [Myxococcota bacterium]|nr:hypothetical protein [Myxococcota bacterium]